MARVTVDFAGMTDLLSEMIRLDKDIDKAIENALEASDRYVTENVKPAIARHRQTGKTEAAVDEDYTVENDGVSAFVEVGFDISKEISESGAPISIFLMYGTPKQKPDRKLYNAVYGSKTRKEIQAIQEQEFYKILNL